MASDFDEARQEVADNRRAIWLLRGCIAVDLVRTLAVQWVRTGLPVIAAVSICLSLAIAEALAAAGRSISARMPHGVEDDDVVVLLFMAQISVLLIATTILISLWVDRQMRRSRK